MADLKGTKTEANLAAAFAGESQAHAKYQYFASKAKKEGYVQIHDIFMETKKVSMKSQVYSPWLVTSKKNMKKDTELYSLMLKVKLYSKKKKKLNGNVLTVVT